MINLSLPRRILDGLVNVAANLGTERDKTSHSQYSVSRISDAQLSAMYQTSWLAKKIVDIPALDATREWRSWKYDKDTIAQLEAAETQLQLQKKVHRATTMGRLHGGSALYIGVPDSGPLNTPLDPKTVKKGGLKYLAPLSKNMLMPGHIDLNVESETFNQPAYYDLVVGETHPRIHPSRLVIFGGALPPDDGLGVSQTLGWSDPVLWSVAEAIQNIDASLKNVANLIFEAKIDVLRIPELSDLVSTQDGELLLERRVNVMGLLKSVNSILVMDKEEEYEQKHANFASLDQILDRFFLAVSGGSDIPMTRLIGQSPAGLNSTGESDLRNYYDRVRAWQKLELSSAMRIIDEVLVRSTLGTYPEDLYYTWNSLWQTSEVERADVGEKIARTIKTLQESQTISPDVLGRAAINAFTESNTLLSGLEKIATDEGDDAFEVPEQTPGDLGRAVPEGTDE